MAQNDIHKLVLESTKGSVRMYNSFWFREEIAGVAPDQRATLANDFAGTWITPAANSLRAVVSNEVTFTAVSVQRYSPYEESVFRLPIVASNVGVVTGTGLPALCAVCVTILTPRGGRRGRGRYYLPPPQAVSVSDSQWSTTHQTAVNNAMSTLNNRYGVFSGYSVSGFRVGVWSRVIAGSAPPFNATAFDFISGWVVRPEVRGLNRRSRLNQ